MVGAMDKMCSSSYISSHTNQLTNPTTPSLLKCPYPTAFQNLHSDAANEFVNSPETQFLMYGIFIPHLFMEHSLLFHLAPLFARCCKHISHVLLLSIRNAISSGQIATPNIAWILAGFFLQWQWIWILVVQWWQCHISTSWTSYMEYALYWHMVLSIIKFLQWTTQTHPPRLLQWQWAHMVSK